MAELSTVARPYAEALFSVAKSSGQGLDAWQAATDELAALMAHPQVAEVVADPKLDHAQVFALLTGLLKAPLPEAGGNFLKLLIENQRLAVLPEVAKQFRRLKNDAEGVADCLIETAFPLSETQVPYPYPSTSPCPMGALRLHRTAIGYEDGYGDGRFPEVE